MIQNIQNIEYAFIIVTMLFLCMYTGNSRFRFFWYTNANMMHPMFMSTYISSQFVETFPFQNNVLAGCTLNKYVYTYYIKIILALEPILNNNFIYGISLEIGNEGEREKDYNGKSK